MSNPFSKLKIKNIIYDVKDAVARANIGNLSDLITVSKDTLVDAINEAARSGGSAGVTWVSSNATSAQIEAAYQSGNVVGVIVSGRVYYLTHRGGTTLHRFTSKYANTLYGLTCNNDEWSSDSRYVAGASIVPARPIGQASEGSSGSFARGDHVHDFSNEYKNALLECFRNVAWINDEGLTYYNALKHVLGIGVLSSISAVFTQGQTVVYPDTSLDSLKSMLTVTANYSDSTSETLEDDDYTLSGTLSAGTSVITVTYENKTTTFNVTVTARPTLTSISAIFTQGQTVVYETDSLDSLKSMLVVTATYSDSSTEVIPAADYTLSGTLTAGTSIITVTYEGETDTFNVTVTASATLVSISAVFTQGQTVVYDTDSLDSLKSMLVVTATYSDSTTQTVPSADYTLSGTLTAGTSTITVSYGGETDTFTVIVTTAVIYTLANRVFDGVDDYEDTNIQLLSSDTSFTIFIDFTAGTFSSDSALLHCVRESSPYPGFFIGERTNPNDNNSPYFRRAYYSQGKATYFEPFDNSRHKFIITHEAGDTNTATCYFDSDVGSTSLGNKITYTAVSQNLLIGCYQTTGGVKGRFWNGTVHECKIWNRVISDSDISDLMGE